MSEKLFFGYSNTTSLISLNPDFHIYSEYVCLFDGDLIKIKYYEAGPGEIKPNLYIKNGSSYDLLWSDDSGQSVVAGWNEIIFSTPVSVSAGETYAIGYNADINTRYRMEAGYILGYKNITYSTFTAPSSFDPGVDGYTVKTDGRVLPVEAYGWEPPTISSINYSEIFDGQTGVILSGTDFMNTGTIIELCDGPIYSSANKVKQIITNQSDNSLEFTVVKNGLNYGTRYLFVTTSLGQRNSIGYSIALTGSISTPLNDTSGTGFFGKGYWGRKVFWLNVPEQWRKLDQYNYLQMLLNTWGDLGENFLEHISILPKQRDPYEVRTKDTWTRWFYVTDSFKYTDDDKGNVVRLIGEKDPDRLPGCDSISAPSTDEDIMLEQFPWYPYEPLADVGRFWQLRWNDAQYEVINVRARNFDQFEIYNQYNSLANEIWVKGGDLTLLFDYLIDRIWDRSIDDDPIQGTVEIGVTDGSQRPKVELPIIPIRLENRWSNIVPPSTLIEASTLRIRIPLQGGGYRILYDLPISENEGTLHADSGGIIGGDIVGNVNYLSGKIDFDLSVLAEFSSQTELSIKAKYQVRGYFMKFNAPPNINYLAQDYGFNNDENDPEDVQRSSIANITKFWSIKSTQDSYRIRGEISLFEVYMQGLYRICSAELAAKLPSGSVYEINSNFYTEIRPIFVRYDHISSDELFYDYNSGSPLWVTIIDNMLVAVDDSRWDGMTIGQAYAIDVTQGYYAKISEVNNVFRGPAVVQTVTQISQEELEVLRWENGYRYEIEMRRCQYEAFNMILDSDGIQIKELFALSVYDYNAAGPQWGTPPNVNDIYYYIDREDTVWTWSSSPSSDPKEDIGTWTVDIRFGIGVSSPIQALDDVAVRYLPLSDDMDCCYCRSSNIRAQVNVIEEAYDFYDTYEKIEHAISRLKTKIGDLLPIHTRIIQWEVTRRFSEECYGVQNGATVLHTLTGEQFLNNTRVLLSVQYRGDSDSGTPNTDLDFRVYSEDTGTVWELLNWNPVTPAGDNETWVDVITDEEIILTSDPSDPGPPIVPFYVSVRAIAGSASTYGDVKWTFKVTTEE